MRIFAKVTTPCLVVDKNKMAANSSRLASRLPAGVILRIHAKTCKSIDAIRHCAAAPPLAVSTLAEAAYFGAHGLRDLIYAVGLAPSKLLRLASLPHTPALVLDNCEAARRLADFAAAMGLRFRVLLEIDCDGHRGGMAPDSPELLRAAEILARAGQSLAGVLTHAGSAYDLENPGPEAFRRLAAQEKGAALAAAASLRAAGHECPIVSVGSTPTAFYCDDFEGISEVRAGVFLFMDGVMACLGLCRPEDIALSVLCSVIGRRQRDGAIIVDAGWSALSCDRGRDFQRWGHGLVCTAEGEIIPGLHVRELNQEHGIILADPGYEAPAPEPGTLLRVLPAHACAAAHGFAGFHAIAGGQELEYWPRIGGW